MGLGHLKAGWVAGDDAFGMSPSFREALAALGMRYVLDVPGSTPVWPWEPSWTSPDYPDYPGFGRPRKPRLVEGQRRTMEQRSDELPEKVWREITGAQGSQGPREARGPGKPGPREARGPGKPGAQGSQGPREARGPGKPGAQGSQGPREARGPGKPGAQGSQGPREARGPGKPGAQGSQGPRSYMFGAQRVRVTRKGKPDQEAWAVYRRNLDGSEPRYYLSNAPEDTMLETLAYVGGSRWPIETEFESEKGDVGLDEYETRSWAGWHHHIARCLLGGAFLLGLQQAWGEKDAPDHPSPSVPGGAGDAAPGTVRPGPVAAVANGYAATQRTGALLPRKTPLRPP